MGFYSSSFTWAATTAVWNGYIGMIDSFFTSAGWVQTTDTGQVGTLSSVPSASTTVGYRVYQMSDALSSTAPVFVLITITANATSLPVFVATVGKGSNGAGTITGTFGTTWAIGPNTSSSPSNFASYGSGDSSGIVIQMWPGATSAPRGAFMVERSRSSSGVATADGLLVANDTTGWFGYQYADPTKVFGWTTHAPVVLPDTVNGVTMSISTTLAGSTTTAPALFSIIAAPDVTPWIPKLVAQVAPGDGGSPLMSPFGTSIQYRLPASGVTGAQLGGSHGTKLALAQYWQ